MPVEPVSITLAAIALLEPAVKGCIEAYGVYKLTKEFGHDFCEYSRKYDAQRARLEEWYNWPFSYTGTPAMSDPFIRVIEEELGAMRANFQLCSDIITKLSPRSISTAPATTLSQPSTEHLVPKKKASLYNRVFHHGKTSGSASDTSTGSDISVASTSSGLAAPSTFTPASSLAAWRPSDTAAATAAENRQQNEAKNRQSSATLTNKIKWLSERTAFLRAVNELIASNDLIESLIRARTLKPKPAPPDESSVSLPEEVLTTQASLHRLHLALRAANRAVTGRLEFGVNLVSNHSLTAEDVIAAYQEVCLRRNSLVFRLQVHKAGEDGDSRLLLAETLCDKPAVNVESSEQANLTGTTIALLPLDPEGADAFVPITHATTPGHTSDTHHIFQDVSANWARTSTLAELLSEDAPERPSRYSLAALLASSHLCFAADKLLVDDSQAHEYHYYDCGSKEETHTGDDKAGIIRDHNRLLSPYLVSGFGSPPRKVSTRAFGGARGAAPVHDPQIVNLGLLLYQIGRWQPLEHASSISARMEQRTVVKEHMHDLYRETGMGFAETVQLCLDWRYTALKDQLASRVRLYEKVVVTLRKLDEAVTVQPYELG